jgi:hypothetical protein
VPTPERQQATGKEEGGYGAAEEGATEDTPPQAQAERPEHEGIENPDKNPDKARDSRDAEGGPGADAG